MRGTALISEVKIWIPDLVIKKAYKDVLPRVQVVVWQKVVILKILFFFSPHHSWHTTPAKPIIVNLWLNLLFSRFMFFFKAEAKKNHSNRKQLYILYTAVHVTVFISHIYEIAGCIMTTTKTKKNRWNVYVRTH